MLNILDVKPELSQHRDFFKRPYILRSKVPVTVGIIVNGNQPLPLVVSDGLLGQAADFCGLVNQHVASPRV
ncbi:hypothetical protein D1872_348120 [compost metagenome]